MDKYTEVRKRFEENADPENAVKIVSSSTEYLLRNARNCTEIF